MQFDFVEEKTFRYVVIVSFLVFLFLSINQGLKLLFIALIIYFLVLFFLCTYWANESHPEKKFIIGFLVSFFHAFVFLCGGFLGLVLAQITLKVYPLLLNYFRENLPY